MEATLDYLMAEKEEDKKYEHVKKAEDKLKIAENIISNVDLTHMEVYGKSVKKVCKVKKKGGEDIRQTDLSLLREAEHQYNLADDMANEYLENSKKIIDRIRGEAKGDWNIDEFDEALLTKMTYQVTRAELREMIATEKDNFTPDRFTQVYKPRLVQKLRETLSGAAGQHLRDEHIEDIIKYTKIDEYNVDPSRVSLSEAIDYLEKYRKQGAVAPKQIDEKHKKPKPKEKVVKGEFAPEEKKKEEKELPKAA